MAKKIDLDHLEALSVASTISIIEMKSQKCQTEKWQKTTVHELIISRRKCKF